MADSSVRGLSSRRLAWEVLKSVAAGAYADVALERCLRESTLQGADRALATELAYGAIRQRRQLDAWLDRLGRVPALKQPPKLRWLLHIGLYQLLMMERIPDAAAVNTSVELAKAIGLARLAPVVNGLLRAARRALDAGESLVSPDSAAGALGLAHSLPDWFTSLLLEWCDADQAQRIAAACNAVPQLDLRVNRLRATPADVTAALADAGIEVHPIPEYEYGLQVIGHSGDLRQWPGYEEGHWCVQDRAAQWVAPLLDPQPGDRILDACAAPGGKTTHLAELIGDQGAVWALDRSAGRLKRVANNAHRLGLESIQAMAADAVDVATKRPEWHGSFQSVLIDAPCSGLGTLARHPDARWRMTPEAIEALLPLQEDIIDGLEPLLAPGGRLVYATCTIHPAENDDQITALLDRHAQLRCLSKHQRWPGDGDGFFAAVLEKQG
ncbi:MAG: 16S rRNA (cytosine(967)-C(5))-methyltransferase [Synechococcus sp.]